jgi:SET domain
VLAQIATAESSGRTQTASVTPPLPVHTSPENYIPPSAFSSQPLPKGYTIADAGATGLGAFASQKYNRGDLILLETPHVQVTLRDDVKDKPAVVSAVNALPPAQKQQFLSLRNSFESDHRSGESAALIGIFQTNSIAMYDDESGIFLEASRFNHSCSPNARYSWNPFRRCLTIHALREIAIGEEIFVSYLAGRNVYGSTRSARQHRLMKYNFTCACAVCSLQGSDAMISDERRKEIAKIWESVPHFGPKQTKRRLLEIARAVHLLQDEGFHSDVDDFTNDAASICAYHSDWESAAYWARLTYETRVAEFGKDSKRAAEVRDVFLNPRSFDLAGTGPRQIFSVRV